MCEINFEGFFVHFMFQVYASPIYNCCIMEIEKNSLEKTNTVFPQFPWKLFFFEFGNRKVTVHKAKGNIT